MKKGSPSVTLIWLYQGKNADARRAEIEDFDYPNFEIVGAVNNIPNHTELCIFWIGDDKPVSRNFIREMTNPLIADDEFRAVMHFWSGNAISLPKSMLDAAGVDGQKANTQSLLRLLLPVIDVAEKGPHGRAHVAFSSTEKLAPLSMDAVGLPS
jgi:hypothetical protein